MRGAAARAARAALIAGVAAAAATATAAEVPVPGPAPTEVPAPGPARVPPLTLDGRTIGEGWQYAGLPRQKPPPTRYSAETIDGVAAVRVDAHGSYGNLVHRPAAPMRAGTLRWRWRVDQGNPRADLREKGGDDTPVRVCLGFAVPLSALPFVDRQLLRLASAASSEALPTTTLCWVWDEQLPAGTVLASPYTRRVRYVVVRGRGQPHGRWLDESRDVAADFQRAYGDEFDALPPVEVVLIGGDSDNTQQQTSAAVAALEVR